MNHISLIGRLTKDPDAKFTESGKAVANFSIAVDRKFKNQAGEKETDFFRCVAWGKTAEFLQNYVSKGRLVAVEGRVQQRKYQAQDGTQREVFEVVADGVETLDKAKEDGPQDEIEELDG